MLEASRDITMSAALNEALREEMTSDRTVFVFGENIIQGGGRYGVTNGLCDIFGSQRIMDAPINEELFVGIALGAAQAGMRPVVEFMYANFLRIAASDVFLAGIWRCKSAGKVRAPFVVRAVISNRKATSSDLLGDPISGFLSAPGIKIVVPSSPYNAKGLLKAAIRDDNPVLFFEHDNLYSEKEAVPDGEYIVPLGQAKIVLPGARVTLIAYGYLTHLIKRDLYQYCEERGVEVIDLLSIKPLDIEAIIKSAEKTRKVLIVEEGWTMGGIGAEILSIIHERCYGVIVKRHGAKDMPVPSGELASSVLPTGESIRSALERLLDVED